MSEHILRFLFGAIVSASGFLVVSMGRLAWKELRRIGFYETTRSIYFWIAALLVCEGVGVSIICTVRVIDSLHRVPSSGGYGWFLVVGFTLLLVSRVGFNWAGTRQLSKGPMIWRTFVLTLVGWTAFLLYWSWMR